MGCSVSKSIAEPCTITIKLSACSNLSRSWSSPIQLADGVQHHLARNPNHPPRSESEHVVCLTSSTYGSLRVDPQDEEHARLAARMGTVMTGNASGVANHKEQVETIDMWKLMEGIEEEKAALKMLHSLMGKQQKNGSGSGSGSEESGKRSPRVYHTVEDVDTILDVRDSLTSNYRLKRGSSMDAVRDKSKSQSTVHSPMMRERRSRALQISQEVIEELDDLRMKNLSRSTEFHSQSQDFNTTKGRNSQKFRSLSRSQDFGIVERNTSQELSLRARRNLSQRRELDFMSRGDLTKNQDHDMRRIRNLSRSQEFVRPPKDDDGVTTRRSSGALRNVLMEDERRRVALLKPDVVLRSPMLRALGGKDIFVSSNNVERRKLQGQVQSAPLERKTTSPRAAAGSTQVSMNLSSLERKSSNKLEPRVASAVAALSRLGERKLASSLV